MREFRMKERNKSQGKWKRKISMLLVLCLILTGSHGLVLSADAQEEQGGSSNRIESKGENILMVMIYVRRQGRLFMKAQNSPLVKA